MILGALGLAALLAWLVLLFGRGGFWRCDQRLGEAGGLAAWPALAVVVPARDEAATVGRALGSLLAQDYPGDYRVILVDDASRDGTAEAAGSDRRLTVVPGRPLAPGWTGKLWAMAQGVERAGEGPVYLLFTDADIAHDPGSLRRLVFKAESGRLDLVSVMVRLVAATFWERLLIPAFVFFFQKLYPFPWVNDPKRREAAAAGGCLLVRRDALARAGGLEAIRGRLIDDCALAGLVKSRGGALWLGFDNRLKSLRGYGSLGGLWRMVARSAFEQLGNSAVLLVVAVAGMAFLYLVPPLAAIGGWIGADPVAGLGGGLAWALMAWAYRPSLGLYDEAPRKALLLPLAGFLYTLMTLDSARRTWQGRGGAWKGRHYRRPGPVGG